MMAQLELEYLTLLSSLPVANIAFFGCTANAQSSPSAWPFQSKTESVTEPWFYSLLKDGRYNSPRLEYSFTAAQPHSILSIVWCCFRHILSYISQELFYIDHNFMPYQLVRNMPHILTSLIFSCISCIYF